jgi:hypothetical protein
MKRNNQKRETRIHGITRAKDLFAYLEPASSDDFASNIATNKLAGLSSA